MYAVIGTMIKDDGGDGFYEARGRFFLVVGKLTTFLKRYFRVAVFHSRIYRLKKNVIRTFIKSMLG